MMRTTVGGSTLLAARKPVGWVGLSDKTIKVLRPNCKVELKSFLPVALNGSGVAASERVAEAH